MFQRYQRTNNSYARSYVKKELTSRNFFAGGGQSCEQK
jgi:hypothetical protein